MPNITGEYIYHEEYGVGQIIRVADNASQDVEIQFRDRQPITLTSFLVDRSSKKISPNGFRVLGYTDPSQATTLILEKPVEVIICTLEDFPSYKAKTEEIKEYLGPYIIDWDAWWEKTQPLLKEDKRIDTTNSKLREYALAREVRSQAEEGYLSFRFAKQRSAEPAQLAEIARSALLLHRKGEPLPLEHRDELLEYLQNVVYFERYDLSLRLGTLFRLREDRFISTDEAHEWLVKLLGREIRLYQMEPYTSRRIIDELLNSPLGEREIEILASGMCASEAVIQQLQIWSLRGSNPRVIGRFLATALSENLPPAVEEKDYKSLNYRLEACIKLLKSLPGNSQTWPEILQGFQKLTASLASAKDLDAIRFLFPVFIELAVELSRLTPTVQNHNLPSVFDSLADPSYPITFILTVMDSARKAKVDPVFINQIEQNLFEKADLRQDNFLSTFLKDRQESTIDRARQITSLIHQYNSTYLIDKGGQEICDMARQASDDELVDLLPFLDQLHQFPGVSPWKTTLEGLREKGYLVMFQERMGKGYHDEALVNAAHRLVDLQLSSIQNEMLERQSRIERAMERIRSLETLLDEKEKLLRELVGSAGGDTDAARFEERTRIFKELVNSIAEFERFLASQANPSREVDAVIKRISNILLNYRVTPTEAIGTQVTFNPQKHRLVESGETSPGDMVTIVERGYIIRDTKDKPRLLKPALVKKI